MRSPTSGFETLFGPRGLQHIKIQDTRAPKPVRLSIPPSRIPLSLRVCPAGCGDRHPEHQFEFPERRTERDPGGFGQRRDQHGRDLEFCSYRSRSHDRTTGRPRRERQVDELISGSVTGQNHHQSDRDRYQRAGSVSVRHGYHHVGPVARCGHGCAALTRSGVPECLLPQRLQRPGFAAAARQRQAPRHHRLRPGVQRCPEVWREAGPGHRQHDRSGQQRWFHRRATHARPLRLLHHGGRRRRRTAALRHAAVSSHRRDQFMYLRHLR